MYVIIELIDQLNIYMMMMMMMLVQLAVMCEEDGETSCRVMKGVTIGACDYLVKPIRVKVLRNIWQHVVRSKIHELSRVEAKQTLEQILKSDAAAAGSCGGENKRKPNESAPHPLKKPRVVWGNTLHDKFVEALRRIGLDSKFVFVYELCMIPSTCVCVCM